MQPMVNWLLIGIGDIARRRVIPALLAEPHSRLAGFVTRDPRKAEPWGLPSWPKNALLRTCERGLSHERRQIHP